MTISGSEAEIVVTSFTDQSGSSQLSSYALSGLQRTVALEGDTNLTGSELEDAPEEMQPGNFYPIGHQVTGYVPTDRSEIDNIDLYIKAVDYTGRECEMRMIGSHMLLLNN